MDDPVDQREPLPPAAVDELKDMLGDDTDELVSLLGAFGLFDEIEDLSDYGDDDI